MDGVLDSLLSICVFDSQSEYRLRDILRENISLAAHPQREPVQTIRTFDRFGNYVESIISKSKVHTYTNDANTCDRYIFNEDMASINVTSVFFSFLLTVVFKITCYTAKVHINREL